ncbi:hypothetical protein [Nitrosophilus alvini]|uniref:hypothetical protein n=1 Tax=Nitrosophilus alvini TaxID=2714855 RepID=UPI00190C250B|nr:hypothetical protein [Nitrosophilus alvini]
MRVYIKSVHFIMLLSPLLVWGFIYFYQELFITSLNESFFVIKKEKSIRISKKIARSYQEIETLVKRNSALLESVKGLEQKKRYLIEILKENRKSVKKTPIIRQGEWKVTFIISGEKKRAIINGKVVSEGDNINGARVLKIEKNRVLIKTYEGVKWLRLFD